MQQGEKFNTFSHFIALLVALPGVIYLVMMAVKTGDLWKISSAVIYSITLLLLYFTSSLYHSHTGRFKKLFQTFDHLSIYLLIAGTYTPFMLVTLRGVWGWSILAVVWGLAFIGIMMDVMSTRSGKDDRRIVQLIIYLLMGWLILIPIKPLADNLSPDGMFWLAIGGVLYTLGVIFFVLDHRLKHSHGIWHLFVIGGSASHFGSIAAYVIQ